jgi:hypothetical protein
MRDVHAYVRTSLTFHAHPNMVRCVFMFMCTFCVYTYACMCISMFANTFMHSCKTKHATFGGCLCSCVYVCVYTHACMYTQISSINVHASPNMEFLVHNSQSYTCMHTCGYVNVHEYTSLDIYACIDEHRYMYMYVKCL